MLVLFRATILFFFLFLLFMLLLLLLVPMLHPPTPPPRGQVRVANLQADQWKKEAETLRTRLASQKEATAQGGNGGTGTTRSPLRQSTGSTGQGRPSVENRGQVW